MAFSLYAVIIFFRVLPPVLKSSFLKLISEITHLFFIDKLFFLILGSKITSTFLTPVNDTVIRPILSIFKSFSISFVFFDLKLFGLGIAILSQQFFVCLSLDKQVLN